MKNKKAFTVGQVFIYIMTLIVFVVILTFGYKAIFSVKEDADKISCIKFQKDLKEQVEGLSNQYQSVRVREFALPIKAQQVCFVDLSTPPAGGDVLDAAGICTQNGENYDAVMCNAWEDGTTNVFLPSSDICEDFKIEEVRLPDKSGSLCLSASFGSLELRLTGLGDSTLLEKK